MSGNIKVAVRCRPMNSREKTRGAVGLIRMQGNQTMLDPPPDAGPNARTHSFAFDHSYDSSGSKDDSTYASQDTLFNDLGRDLLDHAFEGYNTCIFAYGQTGSGKSYSMMGYGADRGIIPLTCSALFDRINQNTTDLLSYTVEVSFIEIYNERVRDLLNPKNKGNLKVREHPSLGPYVEDLSKLGVESFADMERLMDEGNKARTVAATQMNETSSRSHSVFTVLLTQKRIDPETQMAGEKVSRISLVDLAGSERANSTGATGQRLKEGANINKSLTTLGKVIAALAAASTAGTKGAKPRKSAAEFIPYRDSVLTWLLKDSLGGNSKTAMIAAISPADYEETLSTLRYADQAKKIQNKAVVNEDANAKMVRELKEELAMLRQRVTGASGEATYDPHIPPEKQIVTYKTKTGEIKTVSKAELQEQLEQSEKLIADVQQTWEEKMQKTAVIQKEREEALETLGIVIEKGNVGVHTPKKMPHLVNLCEDPLMSECLIYQIKPGKTTVGNVESVDTLDIRLSGPNVLPIHCHFDSSSDGQVELHAMPGSTTMVNGLRIGSEKPKRLRSGYRIILGDIHVFRFNHPEEVRKTRDEKVAVHSSLRESVLAGEIGKSPVLNGDEDGHASGASSPAMRPPSPTTSAVDWNYARKEAVVAKLNGTDVVLDKLEDTELNSLFRDIMKVRSHRRNGTSHGRPESRASFMDSIDEYEDEETTSGSVSRPFSGDTWGTDDTSLDSTLTFSTPSEAEQKLQEVKEEMQQELDAQREEYETKLKTLANSVVAVEDTKAEKRRAEQDLIVMQQQMQEQLDEQKSQYEKKMRRLSRRIQTQATDTSREGYDDYQMTLIRRTLHKWRSLRKVSMAQAALSKAVLLKEANVFSRELDKRVTYQFVIVDEVGVPTSALEGVSALAELEDVSDPPLAAKKIPFVAVKIIDRRSNCIYIWSMERLQQRVQQMHSIIGLMDKPSYSQHFSLEDPFFDTAPSKHTFIGTANFPLAPLYRKLCLLSTARIFSRYTGQQIATCSVRVKPLKIATSPDDGAPNLQKELADKAQYTFEVNIDSLTGLDSTDFASLHCQLRLTSIVGKDQEAEDVYASPIAELDSNGQTRLRLRKTFTISVNTAVREHLRTQSAHIEFFAQVKAAYFTKCEKWDETKEEKAPLRPWQLSRTDSDLAASTTGRRAETELLTEQVYDVKVMLAVQELASNGDYLPVQLISTAPLDPGVFHCHQGLQRRIMISLSHGSGRQWIWHKMQNVQIGKVRLLDPKGQIMDSRESDTLQLKSLGRQAETEYASNGTAVLTFTAGWDSSAHNSLFLNRTTATANRVLLEVSWQLIVEGVSEPIPFAFDIGICMQERDARPPSRFRNLFSTQRVAYQATSMFSVRLNPALANKAADLWRLNTASTFVRGEEILGAWKPRGVSLIYDHQHLRETERALADLATTQAVLASIPAHRLTRLPDPTLADSRMYAALQLWQRRFGTKAEIKLVQDPTWDDVQTATRSPASSSSRKAKDAKKMKAAVKHVRKSETTAKRGYLYLMSDSGSNEWQKVWGVLRRPYLALYRSASESEELPIVINISTVRVDHSTELEEVISRRFAFGIYTPVSALFVASTTYPDMLQWVTLIDPSWQRHT